ncbi:MAG TPA: peptidylprolyl isomerase, partial [Longimicrobiales bacterium]|nr:peptidylprolyl isomerase [Longimicrobiales bacterium]
FRTALDAWIDRLVVLQAAEKDSLIEVDDATIDQQVATGIDQLARQFGGQAALREALFRERGMTLAEFRDIQKQMERQRQLEQLYLSNRLRNARPVEVSEAELRQRFQELAPQLGQRPRTVTFRQVVLQPEPSDNAVAAARAEAEALLDSIRAGADFIQLAERYSDDPGSALQGGDLGWFRRGQMVSEFENAAFSLSAGQVSRVVETDFGFHIIKVERTRGRSEVQARHILIVPEVTQEDVDQARALADSLVEAARSGASMAELYAEHNNDPIAPDSVTIAFDQLDQLPPAYSALRPTRAGDVIGPLEYTAATDRLEDVRLAVVKVVEVREAGAFTFEDMRAQLAQRVQAEKQRQRIIEDLRSRTYIEIRL